jgi:hypothetical protein
MSDVLQVFRAVDAALGARLALDWLLLLAQVSMLGAIAISEIRRATDRNLIALLVVGALLVLVQGQEWWVLAKLETASYVQHLYQLITLDGDRLANLSVTLAVGAFAVVYLVNRRRPAPEPDGRSKAPAAATERVPYVLLSCWTLAAAALLLASSGGLAELVGAPNRIEAGQAGELMGLGVAKLPLLDAVACGRRPRPYALVLFGLVIALTLLKSRFLAIFVLLQLAVIWNYRRAELSRRWLAPLAATGALMLVGFGLYRDLVSYFPAGTPLDSLTIQRFSAERTAGGLADWFYGLNVEGFAGFAGIVTYTLLNGTIAHDYGLSTLRFVTQLLPNSWRTDPGLPFMGISQTLEHAYPYHGSVVSPGFELAFGHFGLIGVVALGGVLGYLCRRFHGSLQTGHGDRLLAGLLSVQPLQIVRGTFVTVLVFGLGDIVGLRLYRAMAEIEAGATAPRSLPAPRRARP